jgi:hypothetical protein
MPVVGGRLVATLPELLEQVGTQAAWIGKLLELRARKLLQARFRCNPIRVFRGYASGFVS